jgi:release factor glutamine methyltransferase
MSCVDRSFVRAEDKSTRELRRIYRRASGTLRRAGIPAPELDARLLICRACGISHEAYVAEQTYQLSAPELVELGMLVDRRLRREPISRIIGRREFWSLPFAVVGETLDPRPDTELVVETALKIARRHGTNPEGLKVLDIGTGSGCILVSLLSELRSAWGLGTDISEAALETARRNATAIGVAGRTGFVVMDWLAGLSGKFDIVVCNPPYIRRDRIAELAPEVAIFDPSRALDGGGDGLLAYRAIIPFLKNVLAGGGWVVFETGDMQAAAVLVMLSDNGLGEVADFPAIHCDLAGNERVVVGQLCA